MPSQLQMSQLSPYRPRQYVPADADLSDVATVSCLFEAIVRKPPTEAEAFVRWYETFFELQAAVDQLQSALYIAMTCHTDDPKCATAYSAFVERVLPAIKPHQQAFKEAFVSARAEFAPGDPRFDVLTRNWESDIALYRVANTPLETEDDLLAQQYQTVCGAMTVQFNGVEQTLPQLTKYQLETDRDVRERAWRALAARRLADRDSMDEIFDHMVALRTQVAGHADCHDYIDYQFKKKWRFDYSRADCIAYHRAVELCVVPAFGGILSRRKADLGVDALRPWDLAVDPFGRAPLKPFADEADFIQRCSLVFDRTDCELGTQFREMHALGLLDLVSRKGKAPGGYQATLTETRKPFIFMNAVGLDNDLRTLLHEGGHAFHAYACAHHEIHPYRDPPIEICEVASFGMELLGGEHLESFYSESDCLRSRREFFEGKIAMLAAVALIDVFQFWIYTHPRHSRDERREAWRALHFRFTGHGVDWSGLDAELESLWHRQIHIFAYPLYYIE